MASAQRERVPLRREHLPRVEDPSDASSLRNSGPTTPASLAPSLVPMAHWQLPSLNLKGNALSAAGAASLAPA
jgi:hypothetical protein